MLQNGDKTASLLLSLKSMEANAIEVKKGKKKTRKLLHIGKKRASGRTVES